MAGIVLRPARLAELPVIMDLNIKAFGEKAGQPQAFFPDAARRAIDFSAWRLLNATATFADPGRHHIVAIARRDDGSEVIAGCAEWIAPGGPDPDTSAEEKKLKSEKIRKQWPSSLDRDAMTDFGNTVGTAIRVALKSIGLPEDADGDMWDLNSLAVNATYQRRGIGQMLVQWGIDRAMAQRKSILIMANPTGTFLYRKMGFEQIGQTEVFTGKPYQQRERVFAMRHKA